MNSLRVAVLWLFVLFLGVALGAGIYESRIVVPQWLPAGEAGVYWDAAAARTADTGRRFWLYVTTVPLTALTLASLLLVRGAADTGLRRWWLAAAVISLIDRLITFGYFIPTMLTLTGSTPPPAADAVEVARQWQNLDLARDVISLLAFLAGLKALSLLGVRRQDRRPVGA